MQDLDSSEKNQMLQLRQEHESNSTKLDWMYGNPNHVQDEEYLLGRAVDSSKNHVEHECIPPSIRDLQTLNEDDDQVDIAKKLQEDPLMEIHRRQIEARKKMLQNPIKLKQMQQMLSSKSTKKRKQSESENDTSSESEDDDNLDKKLMEKFLKLQKLHKKKKRKKSKRKHSTDNENSDRKKRKKSKKKYSESSNDGERKSRKRSKEVTTTDDERKRKKSKKTSDNDSTKSSKKKQRHSESKSKRKHKKSYSQEREMQYEKYRNRSNSRERTTKNYGLVNADGEKITSTNQSHKAHEKKLAKQPLIEEKKWVKPSRQVLTEEEKEKRRQEMLENVRWKEKTRTKLRPNDDDMDHDLHKNYKDDPEFLKKYLLKSTDFGSVEARIKSNINNIQRRTTDMESNFARR